MIKKFGMFFMSHSVLGYLHVLLCDV